MNLGEYRDDPSERRGMVRSVSSGQAGGGYSGSSYDRWSYEQSARAGAGSNDTPLNKLQYKYWVTKSKVVRKLGKDEDECVVASDAELDAKLELYHSISQTTKDLQNILDQYNDRLCNLAYEENSMGRFLKDFGKLDKTRAGKIMIASGKALSYSSQQRLALRPSIVRLAEEVDTFRFRAIEDTSMTVSSMEKVRTEYRGALMWMKNVSTELDPDTYKQLEKFRKVQGHVKSSKQKFDKLKVDCIQKIDLLAAARCNMYSHALITYQDSLAEFCQKVAKTFTHVEQSFKGYQPYEFQYIKELAEPNRMFKDLNKKKKNKGQEEASKKVEKEAQEKEVKDENYFFDLGDESSDAKQTETAMDALELAQQSEASLNNLLELEDKDDELLLQWEEKNKNKNEGPKSNIDLLGQLDEKTPALDDFLSSPIKESSETGDDQDSPARFTAQWNKLFGQEPKPMDDSSVPDLRLDTLGQFNDDSEEFGSFFSAPSLTTPSDKGEAKSAILPSQLFDLDQSLFSVQSPRQGPHDLLSDFPMPSPARPSAVQKQLDMLNQQKEESQTLNLLTELQLENPAAAGSAELSSSSLLPSPPPNSNTAAQKTSNKSSKDMSQWFSLFADLDPLANPDAIGKSTKESDPNCYS